MGVGDLRAQAVQDEHRPLSAQGIEEQDQPTGVALHRHPEPDDDVGNRIPPPAAAPREADGNRGTYNPNAAVEPRPRAQNGGR